jgi:hypothetical protein
MSCPVFSPVFHKNDGLFLVKDCRFFLKKTIRQGAAGFFMGKEYYFFEFIPEMTKT